MNTRDIWAPAAVDQLGFIVDDMSAASDHWNELGAGPFSVNAADAPRPFIFRGEAVELALTTAIGYAGTTQIELIQQRCRQRSAYREFVDTAGAGLHHVARFTDSYDADLILAQQGGLVCVMFGNIGTGLRFSYWERADAGVRHPVLEFVSAGDELTALTRPRYTAHIDGSGDARTAH